MLFQVTIPIDNYETNGVFFKELYFESNHSPTLDEVRKYCNDKMIEEQKLAEDHPEWGPFCAEYGQCTVILGCVTEFPSVNGNCISSNEFVYHYRWKRQPITITRITPFKLE